MNKRSKSHNLIKTELCHVKSWAQDMIQDGSQPPWAWYQYMKLIEATDAILNGMNATTQTANLQQSAEHEEKHLRLVGSKCLPDTAQPHRVETPVQMPM